MSVRGTHVPEHLRLPIAGVTPHLAQERAGEIGRTRGPSLARIEDLDGAPTP